MRGEGVGVKMQICKNSIIKPKIAKIFKTKISIKIKPIMSQTSKIA